MAANDNFIKKFIAANKKSIDAIKAANPSKKGVGGRKKKNAGDTLTDADREDAGFPTRTARAQQQLNPTAMLGSSAAPMAPPSASKSPIQAPQTGGGIFQGIVSQINQASLLANAYTGVNPSTDYFSRSYKTAASAKRDFDKQLSSDLMKSGIDKDVRAFEKNQKSVASAAKMAMRYDSKAVADGMRNDYLSMRNSIHPDLRQAFDSANGIKTSSSQQLDDLNEGTKLLAKSNSPRSVAKGMSFRMFSAFRVMNRIIQMGEQAKAVNTPDAQLGPLADILGAAARLAPGIGGPIALLGMAAINTRKAYENSENTAVQSDLSLAMQRVGFGNDRRFQQITRNARQMATGSQTWFEYTKNKLGFEGELEAKIADNAKRTLAADMRAGAEMHLYGGGADKSIARWAAEHKIPIQSVPDSVRKKLIDAAVVAKRKEFELNNEVLRGVDADTPSDFGMKGAKRDSVQRELRNKAVDDIFLNTTGQYGDRGRLTPAQARMEAEDRIKTYLETHSTQIQKREEDNRNVQLTAKAERHRHLAEF